ncbi:MAG: N-acetylneuraminate lyase [Clostridia bacterium]|nr:N-acetylneuraminate lyase [Clostridia bacterium]
MKNFKGLYTALLTPFDKEGKINKDVLTKLIKYNIEKGVDGFYACGTTAEAFLMSTQDRMTLLEYTKEAAEDKKIIAHIGSLNEDDAIAMAKHAESIGCDAISSVAPFYYKFSFEDIKNYYYRIAESVNVPMLVYNFPMNTGVTMTMKELDQFFTSDRFFGLKHTSSDFFTMEQVKANYPDKIALNGFDEMFLAGLSMGADGGIGSTYNFMADKFVKIRQLFTENRIAEAQEIQHTVNKIIAVLFKVGLMPAQKEVLNQIGFDFGVCKHPFGELDADAKKLIADEVIPLL